MTNKMEKLYICNVCGEEYSGNKRKWTCPICGTADSFESADDFNRFKMDDSDDDIY